MVCHLKVETWFEDEVIRECNSPLEDIIIVLDGEVEVLLRVSTNLPVVLDVLYHRCYFGLNHALLNEDNL